MQMFHRPPWSIKLLEHKMRTREEPRMCGHADIYDATRVQAGGTHAKKLLVFLLAVMCVLRHTHHCWLCNLPS